MTLGEIIKTYRTQHGLSQASIAEKSGLSKAYISILERNLNPKTNEPPVATPKTINAIAKALNTNFDAIFSKLDDNLKIVVGEQIPRTVLPSNLVPLTSMKKVPLIGTIACGTPILAEENITDYIDAPGHIHADYALTCKGDSMINAGINDGDIVYIRKQETVENGQIAAVMVGEDEATLKRFYVENGVVTLNAENPAYPPKTFVGEEAAQIHVLGLAVAFLHHMV